MARMRTFPECPRCQKSFVRWSKRRGAYEQAVSFLYFYPFRCQLCAHRFLTFQPGARATRYTPDRREYVRIPVHASAAFSGEQVQGKGTLVNLSMSGCAMQTNVLPRPGEVLWLRLDGWNGYPQVVIDAARVRTLEKQEVGLEVLRVQDGEKKKLQQVIETLLRRCQEY
jgi:c-di-GMP-binding flagellar brake protein YcgR